MRYQLVERGEEKFFNTKEEAFQYIIDKYVEGDHFLGNEDFLDKEDLIEEYKTSLSDLDIENYASFSLYSEGFEYDSIRVYDTTRQRYSAEPIRYIMGIEYYNREELINLRNAIDERLKEI